VPLERAIQAVKTFAPLPTRMSSYKTPDGVTFIRDEQKAPLWAIPVCLDFMKKAKAERKIIVMGSISDTPKGFYHRYRTVIQQATDIVDKMVFVGDHAYSALRMRANPEDNRITALSTVYELNSFLSKYLKPGDLVLLKGSLPSDHLERIVLSQTNDIACWREKCGKHRLCSDCRYQHSPFVPTDTVNVS